MLSPIWGITTSVMSLLSFRSREDGVLEQHLAIENAAEMRRQFPGHFFQRRAARQAAAIEVTGLVSPQGTMYWK